MTPGAVKQSKGTHSLRSPDYSFPPGFGLTGQGQVRIMQNKNACPRDFSYVCSSDSIGLRPWSQPPHGCRCVSSASSIETKPASRTHSKCAKQTQSLRFWAENGDKYGMQNLICLMAQPVWRESWICHRLEATTQVPVQSQWNRGMAMAVMTTPKAARMPHSGKTSIQDLPNDMTSWSP